MVTVDATKAEVIALLKELFTKSGPARVDVADSEDWQGEPSLDIRVVFRRSPAKDEMRYARPRLVDRLRTWLSQHNDGRFPYFSFLTEKDEKELLSQT